MPTGASSVRIHQMNKIISNTDLLNDNCSLFVLIGANRLSYFITSPDNQVLVQETQPIEDETLTNIFKKNTYINQNFVDVKVGFISPYSTLVPNLIYKETAATSYLENSFRIPQQHYLLTDNVKSITCQNVFLAPINIYNFFQNKYSHAVFYHVLTPLLVAWQEKAIEFDKPTVFINVIGQQFQLAAFDREKLLISNTYEYETAKDFIYYTLLVFDQLSLSVEDSKVFLSGEIMQASNIYKLLYRYIRAISFMNRNNYYKFDNKFNHQPKHFNYDLFSFSMIINK